MRKISVIITIIFISVNISVCMECKDNNDKTKKLIQIFNSKEFDKLNKEHIAQAISLGKDLKIYYLNYIKYCEKEQPADFILYLIGITQDTAYFHPLTSVLENSDYIYRDCIYYCGLSFALILTSPEKKIYSIRKIVDRVTVVSDAIRGYEKYNNQIPVDNKRRKEKLSQSLNFSEKSMQNRFEEIQNMEMSEVISIASNLKISLAERLMAIKTVEYLVNSTEYFADILYILINSPRDGSQEIKGSCHKALLNILARNKNK